MKIKKWNAVVIQLWRKILDHCLRYSHWLAVAAILAIILHDHPTPYITIGGCGLFIYFLVKQKMLAISFLSVFLLMFIDTMIQTPSPIPSKNKNHWLATVQSIPIIDGDQLTLDMKGEHQEILRGMYKIKSQQEKERLMNDLQVGMTCRINGTLEQSHPPTNFNAFNYPAYLKHHGISALLQISEIKRCQDNNIGAITRIKRFRQYGIKQVNQNFPESMSGMINALVFGDRSNMPPDVLQAYQTLGLVHLLAVSGLHVGIVMTMCYVILLRMGIAKEHVQLCLLIIIIPLYAVLTGLSASVLRASFMFGLALMSALLKRKMAPVSIVGIACLILLLLNPDVVFDIGFELSFLIAFAIVVSAPIIQKRYRNNLLRTFMLTGIAQTAALPIIIYNFYSISFLSFILNLIFIPFISLIVLPLSILSVVIMIFSPASSAILVQWLSWMVIPAHDLLLKCQSLHAFNVVIGRPNEWGMIILILGGFSVLVMWEKWKHPLSAFLPFSFILMIGFTHHIIQWSDPNGSVIFLDVGQGDSILIQLPHGKGVMLIDTGGRLPFPQSDWQKRKDPYDIGKDVVAEQLKAQGIAKIDWLVLTHRDMDHIGGFNGLIDKVPIDSIIISKVFQESKTEKTWFKKAQRMGIHIERVPEDTVWGSGGEYLKVLWPTQFQPTSNNRSLVLFARLGGENWLFTGDLEKEGEEGVLKRFPNLHIDVLKVGHHGSRTSSTPSFIDKIKPKLAVISVGENNRFGHPHPDVLKTFAKYHVPILRTDRDGAIKIIFNNERMISVLKAKK